MSDESDQFIGQVIRDYELVERLGAGRIGCVYKAVRKEPFNVLACKIIPQENLKQGWDAEIKKVTRLAGVPNVVPYHDHGSQIGKNGHPFVWILWDFIDGWNLQEYLKNNVNNIDLAFVQLILGKLLEVLHACSSESIVHGDLHEGNILISKPDKRILGSPTRVFISDFGYGGSDTDVKPKDDFKGMFAVAKHLLTNVNRASLNARDRILYEKIKEFSSKELLETEKVQGNYVRNPEILLEKLKAMSLEAEREAAAPKGEGLQSPGDFLSAEALGFKVTEWKKLFVPDVIAARELLAQNITILTGARGCGKTMSFRRLTLYMDYLIGETSGVIGSDQFIGLYVNCRDLVEIFPWVPNELGESAQQQVIHFFHLCWLAEVCNTLAIVSEDAGYDQFAWLDEFLKGLFGERYKSLPLGSDELSHARFFIDQEKERCRLIRLGSVEGYEAWPLARFDFLDMLQNTLETRVPIFSQKPFYMFLDDYSIPLIPAALQQSLNAIIFKRRSKLFFKISTESQNSILLQDFRGKMLQLNHDFQMVDLAAETLHQDEDFRTRLISKIFKPRIDRHSAFGGKNLQLEEVLGHFGMSNNDLAKMMRNERSKKRIHYHGIEAFVGVWSSDIRILIEIFLEILRLSESSLNRGEILIPLLNQDKALASAGGDFLEYAKSIEQEPGTRTAKKSMEFGRQLIQTVDAFAAVSKYEMTKGKLVSNQGRMNPKQAFRLEIIDSLSLSETAVRYYDGLIRSHIFLNDRRGRSVRGRLNPRLYLNRVLIPYCKLTFSSHDHIQLTSEQFEHLLVNPKTFFSRWKRDYRGASESLGKWTN
ncbi:MAG: protein kinase family protein [Thaumarchaeota archaeon]|nr:protein kinase family protein [Nitrososphaerota archaeon]